MNKTETPPPRPSCPGDCDWIAGLFERTHAALYAYAIARGADPQSALDAVQESFLRLCQQPPKVSNYATAWLYRTCRNLIVDNARRRTAMPLSPEQLRDTATADGDDPCSTLQTAEEADRCRQAIAGLSDQQQEVLQLRLTHELSYSQIADITGLSVNHVGVTIHQALKKLRTQLA